MKKTAHIKLFFSFLIAIICLAQWLVTTSCANIVPPAGGPRDSLPPVLLKANPPNKSTNFAKDRVVLTFDEYVDLEEPGKNIVLSPLPENPVKPNRNLNVVTVKLMDSALEANTTYTIDFGNSIKDINEGNVLKHYSYTFTTGQYFDSLQLDGKIMLAETGETDSTMTAMLYREKDDSAVYNNRPRYVVKTDGKGNFHFKNLAPGAYYLYALKDDNQQYRYTSAKIQFAFADSAVQVNQATKPVTLYAYIGEKEAPTTNNNTASGKPAKLAPGEKPRIKFSINQQAGRQDLLDKFIFTFENRLRSYDSSKIHISTDTSFTPVTAAYTWQLDSTKKNLILDYPWKENTTYNIVLEKDFATDTLGQQLLRPDTLNFITKSKSDYAKVTIRFRNLDLSKNPVLIFVQGSQIYQSYTLTGPSFTNDMFPPGDYEIRILNDANKNGKWDPGVFFGKHLQPEMVKPIPRKLTIKSNWENAFEIAL
ncbi:MAG: Ig-like domain-containing protein [Chitinophagaceae bacterium]